MKRNVFTVIIMTLLLSLLINACGKEAEQEKETEQQVSPKELQAESDADSIIIELVGKDSLTVFEILKAEHEVEYKYSATGLFVLGIDSVSNGNNHFWLYSVNNRMVRSACDKFLSQDGDTIKWHYRNILK